MIRAKLLVRSTFSFITFEQVRVKLHRKNLELDLHKQLSSLDNLQHRSAKQNLIEIRSIFSEAINADRIILSYFIAFVSAASQNYDNSRTTCSLDCTEIYNGRIYWRRLKFFYGGEPRFTLLYGQAFVLT